MMRPPAPLLIGLLLAGCASATPGRPVSADKVHYRCDGGETVAATYIHYGDRGPTFVVLDWRGEEYGLAPALSASGARYAGLFGPTVSGHGLEWWEAKGTATLGAFTGKDFADTRPLLVDCRPARALPPG